MMLVPLLSLGLLGLLGGIGLLVFFALLRKQGAFCASLGCLAVPAGVLGPLALLSWWHAPVAPSREDMTGRWEIHHKLYPGPDADWQRQHFWIEINGNELALHDATYRKPRRASAPIRWAVQPEYRFRLDHEPKHHLFASGGPAMYRGRNGCYLVFRSSRYGNMFFEKVAD